MTRIDLDANEVPLGHADGLWVAQQELADVIREWPDHLYHFTPEDLELAASRMIHRYLRTLIRTQQQARVLSLVER